MKRIFLALIAAVIFFNPGHTQNDTMYLMKAGAIVGKYNVNTQVDSVIFYKLLSQASGAYTDTRDGNVYKWVKIGNQVWMAENLKYLPAVVAQATGSQTTPYYYVYGYNGTSVADAKATTNYSTYGVLYNWPAVMNGATSSTANPSGVKGVCPTGWHLPSDAEWKVLTDYLGGTSGAGGKLRETGTTHWLSPNAGATNEIGFTALPGGERLGNGTLYGIGFVGYWWSATEYDTAKSWGRDLLYNDIVVGIGHYGKDSGISVRCIKD